jgi:hypothetical protein
MNFPITGTGRITAAGEKAAEESFHQEFDSLGEQLRVMSDDVLRLYIASLLDEIDHNTNRLGPLLRAIVERIDRLESKKSE